MSTETLPAENVAVDDARVAAVGDEVAPAPARSGRRGGKSMLSHHVIFLLICSAAIVGSFLLGVNTGSKITTPWLHVPTPSVCQFHNLTGLDCPGCGLTRAFVSIAHGNLAAAWRYNGASLLVFSFVLAQIPYRSVQIWRIRNGLPELYWPRTSNVIVWIVVAALFAQWMFKMATYAFT